MEDKCKICITDLKNMSRVVRMLMSTKYVKFFKTEVKNEYIVLTHTHKKNTVALLMMMGCRLNDFAN